MSNVLDLLINEEIKETKLGKDVYTWYLHL